MSRWSVTHPDGPGLPQTFGSRLDQADDARKAAKEDAPDSVTSPCPACGRPSRMMVVGGACPYENCRYGS